MKLDRNLNENGMGKYALIKLRVAMPTPVAQNASVQGVLTPTHYEVPADAVDFGNTDDTDFFVIRLKDKYAAEALRAYADQAAKDDPEYGREVFQLAVKALNHPNRRLPD